MQVSVVPASFDVVMASVSPPPYDALDLGPALMEVMRETAVSFSTIMTNSWNILAISEHLWQFVQFPVEVEPSDAALVHVSAPLASVMGL